MKSPQWLLNAAPPISGVYYDPNCNPEDINHAVLLVGYGVTSRGQQYWIVKNRWVRVPVPVPVRVVVLSPPRHRL